MLIKIRYESCWQNSFLNGSNNEPIPDKGRKFIASITELKREGNYISRKISKDTIMGVLNRLIGEQRKLYQARNREDYYFREIEEVLTQEAITDISEKTQELVYIRNITGSTDQNSWTGEVIENHPVFTSDFSCEFWSTLWLSKDQLVNLIINPNCRATLVNPSLINPQTIASRAIEIQAIKKIDIDDEISKAVEVLSKTLNINNYLEDDGKVKLERLYAGALYLLTERLNAFYDITNATKSEKGKFYVYGFSKRGFNGFW